MEPLVLLAMAEQGGKQMDKNPLQLPHMAGTKERLIASRLSSGFLTCTLHLHMERERNFTGFGQPNLA